MSGLSSAGTVIDLKKTRAQEAGGNHSANPKAVSMTPSEVAKRSTEDEQLVQVITTKTVEFSENNIIRVETTHFPGVGRSFGDR